MSPSTKRDSFHWPKYSLIVGTITTSAVNASDARRLPGLRRAVELARVAVEGVGGCGEDACVGQHLAELDRAVAVEVGRACPVRSRARAPEHALGEVVEVAGLRRTRPSGSSRSNGTALAGSSCALEPASMMTSYSASDGVPATTPSIRS